MEMERRMRNVMATVLTFAAGVVLQAAFAGGSFPADIDEFAACEARFAKLMKTVLPKAARQMADGTQVYNPDAGGRYDAMRLRDFAYMAEGETVPREDVVNEAMIFLNAVSKDYEGVDCVRHDGRPCFMPGGGRMGAKPVADGGPFTISAAYLAWKQGGDDRFIAMPTLDKLTRVFAAIPRAPDGSWLAWIDSKDPFERCPYGYTDTVRKQGACLFTSLLKIEAGRRLAEMLEAGGQDALAGRVSEKTDKIVDAVNRVFWDESVGLYRAATEKCREHDVWGSAFAVWLGVAPEDRADRIAATFAAQYDGLVHAGQIRHLLPGVYWEDARDADGSPIPHDVYQNGGYWGTATGWFCWTLARKDRALALRTFQDLATDYEKGGACEWHYAAKAPCPWEDPRPCSGGYSANLGLPLAALHRFMFEGCYTVRRGTDWIPVECKKSIVKGSALDFSEMGLADAPAGKHGWLKVVDGHFVFEDSPKRRQRFSGPNLCFEGCCPPEDLTEELADRIVRLGYNTIRVHHHETTLSMGDKGWNGLYDWHVFAPEKIARFDRFMAACFKRGIYVTTDLFVSRIVLWKDVGEKLGNKEDAWVNPRNLYKALVMLDEVAYKDWCAWARLFLTHRNPHTGRTYAEEPGMPLLVLVNENCIGPVWSVLRTHPLFIAEWKRWLAEERAKDPGFLEGVTDDLTSDKAPAAGTSPFFHFTAHLEAKFFTRASKFLREELGVKALLTSQNNGGREPPLQRVREKLYDYSDAHHYDEHPIWDSYLRHAGAPKFYLTRQRDCNPILDRWVGGNSGAFTRLVNKPIVFTESDHVYPARYRVAYGLTMGAISAQQEYDGIWRFGWTMNWNEKCRELRDEVRVPPQYFDMLSDPLGLATERLVTLSFLRRDVPALAEPGLAVRLDKRYFGRDVGKNFNPLFPVHYACDRKIAACVDAPVPAGWKEIGADAIIAATNGLPVAADPNRALVYDGDAQNMRLATKRTCAAFAFKEAGRVEAGPLAFTLDRAFALVSASSVDVKPTPLASAKRILVMHLTNLQAEGSVFSDDTFRYFMKKGVAAVVADGVANIELALKRPETYSVWALDTAGNRMGKVASTVKDGRLSFTARVKGPDGKARFLYEVVRQ